MKLTLPAFGLPLPAPKPVFGNTPASQPTQPSKALVIPWQPWKPALTDDTGSGGDTCDINMGRMKGIFEMTLEDYGKIFSDPDRVLFAASMYDLLFACALTAEERKERVSTVKTLLRKLDDKFLKQPWVEPMPWRDRNEPFTMGDMALNLMVVYGTPEDVEYCLKDRKIDPNGFSPVTFHAQYPTPLHRAVDARKPDNIAVLLKYLKPEHLRVVSHYRETARDYAYYHRSDLRTLEMLDEAYQKAGLD